ncbi:hypothetical protein E4T47_01437 [Aureobasidium subglaciale]|nr:hypothetical protein E4T47_01437 [Aureobasidium subglaciale]
MKLSKIATSVAAVQDTAGTAMTIPVVFGSTALAISTPTTVVIPSLILTNTHQELRNRHEYDCLANWMAQGMASEDVAIAVPTATTLMTETPVPNTEMTISNTTEQTADLTKRNSQEDDDHSASWWQHLKWLLGSW